MNSGTYQIDCYDQNGDYEYEVKVGNKEKDMLIVSHT